jgi:hypothetical protein
MSNGWEKVVEEGQTFWVNDDFGNVYQQSQDSYIAMFPKVVKLGPFKSPEEAQKVLESCKQKIEQALDIVNEELVQSRVK